MAGPLVCCNTIWQQLTLPCVRATSQSGSLCLSRWVQSACEPFWALVCSVSHALFQPHLAMGVFASWTQQTHWNGNGNSNGEMLPCPVIMSSHPQIVDVAAWQRQHLAGAALEAQVAWWKQTLAGAPPLLELPWEKPRPDVAASTGISVPLDLSATMAAGLRQLAAAEHTTLFNVLLAAVKVCSFLDRTSYNISAEELHSRDLGATRIHATGGT